MRRGVVLFARSREPHAAALEREFVRRKRPVVRLNPATYPRSRALSLRIGSDADPEPITDDDVFDNAGAGWFGTGRTVTLSGEIAARAKRFARFAALQGLDSFLRAVNMAWINDYMVAARADDKFHQLVVAKRLGFTIPETLFTNDPAEFIRFQRRHPDMIAKSASGSHGLTPDERILTSRVRVSDLKDARAVSFAPVMFQSYVPKLFEMRVTVVGDDVFPVRIHSQDAKRTRVDWRRYHPRMRYELVRLPRVVKDRCVRVARELGLDYGGIDLVETPDGDHVFLEINSLPAWLWLEDATKAPITRTLADLIESRIGYSS